MGTVGNLKDHFALDGLDQNHLDWEELGVNSVERKTQWASSRQVDVAIERMGSLQEPWLIVVALSGSHDPFQPPPPDLISVPGFGVDQDEIWFNEMVEALDTDVGRLMDATPMERTTVMFLSDNGTQGSVSGELDPDRVKKTVYEGGVRVPFIVAGPGIPAGVRVPDLIQVTDVFATVADLAGAPLTQDQVARTDSISFTPVLFGAPASPGDRQYVTAERLEPLGHGPWTLGEQMIRDREYKLIRRIGAGDEFYDMRFVDYEAEDLLQSGLDVNAQLAYERLQAALPPLPQ